MSCAILCMQESHQQLSSASDFCILLFLDVCKAPRAGWLFSFSLRPLMASFYIFLSLWTFQTLICVVGPAWYLSMIQARVPVQARQDQFPQLASIIRYFQYSQTSDPFLSHSDEPCGLTAGCSLFPTPVWSALVPITCLHYFYHGLHHMQHLFLLSNKAKEKNLVSLQ